MLSIVHQLEGLHSSVLSVVLGPHLSNDFYSLSGAEIEGLPLLKLICNIDSSI